MYTEDSHLHPPPIVGNGTFPGAFPSQDLQRTHSSQPGWTEDQPQESPSAWDTAACVGSKVRSCEKVKMYLKHLEKPFKPVSPSSTAILLWDSQPLTHVQSVRIHLDPPERSLPAPLSTGTVRPRVSHHPASFSVRPGIRGEMCPKSVLQLQPVWPAHEPWHMELCFQPQLQLAALQRLRLLRRCLKTAALKHKCKHIKQCYVKERK